MGSKLLLKGFKKYFFSYFVCDDFLLEKDFKYLSTVNTDNFLTKDTQFKEIYSLKLSTENKIIESHALNESILNIFDNNFFLELNKYSQNRLEKILSKLSPMKVNLIDYYQFQLVLIGKNTDYPIHDDIPDKLLSVVIYLAPGKNIGTKIYPCPAYHFEDKVIYPSECVQIPWKENRAFLFSRIGQKTWHSYQGDGTNSRLTLVINVCTNRTDEVINLECSKAFKDTIVWTN